MNSCSEQIHLTVATIVELEGKFLFVEEDCRGEVVINQPAGHVENGESLTEAAVRETFEETGWQVKPDALIGMHRWMHPETQETYFRATFSARAVDHDDRHALDDGIIRALWLTPSELQREAHRLRSPLVARCLQDYLDQIRYPLSLLISL